jgi:hypothetical protein
VGLDEIKNFLPIDARIGTAPTGTPAPSGSRTAPGSDSSSIAARVT